MATRSRKSQERNPDDPSLEEILQAVSDPVHNTLLGVDPMAIFRLVYTVSALGGMVSIWYDLRNKRISFSVRLWGSALSYNVEVPSQFSLTSEPIVEKLCKVLATKNIPPPPPYPKVQLVPKP